MFSSRASGLSLWLMLAALLGCGLAQAPAHAPTKKLIELGWDMPTPQVLRDHAAQLAAAPFDGLTLKLSGGQLVFKKEDFDAAQVKKDVEILKSLSSLPNSPAVI